MQRPTIYRVVLFIFLTALGLAGTYFLFATETGRHLRDSTEQDREMLRRWVHSHEVAARVTLVAAYILLAILVLPIWWLQILAGFSLGFLPAVFWCQVSALFGGVAAHQISRWLLADWVHNKLEARMAKLRTLDETLGHNGLLVVMTTRLTHLAPFGLSNYIFGVTNISAIDVAIGTLLGGIPTSSLYTMIGANPERIKDWRFTGAIVTINLLLLIPLTLRYLRPEWFKKIGVE